MKRSLFALMQSGQGEQKTRRGVNKEMDVSSAVTGSSAIKAAAAAAAAAARFYPTFAMAMLMDYALPSKSLSEARSVFFFSGGDTRF